MEFPDVLASNQATLYGVLLAGALIFLGLLMRPKSKNLPPVVRTIPVIGGLLKFLNGPVQMAREEYDRLGPVFTCKVLTRNITFLIGPEVSENFFKAPEAEMSQKEVYKFNVPTFGPDVVFAVDYPIRVEQYRFFMEALKVSRLKGYVDAMVEEAQVHFSCRFDFSGTEIQANFFLIALWFTDIHSFPRFTSFLRVLFTVARTACVCRRFQFLCCC